MKILNILNFLFGILLFSFLSVSDAQEPPTEENDRTIVEQSGKGDFFVSKADSLEKSYPGTAILAIILMVVWLSLVIWYLYWAINRYAQNYGLSDKEWKILNPEAYAKEEELDKYREIRIRIIERAKKEYELLYPGKPFQGVIPALVEPPKNPYAKDSFGLPPGTIRGILAITAMFAFVVIECANLFSPANLERDFSELLMVFQMVIAFYFGARAVEIFKKKEEEKPDIIEVKKPIQIPVARTEPIDDKDIPEPEPQEKVKSPVSIDNFELPAEKPVIPVEKTKERQQNAAPVIIKPEIIGEVNKKSILSLEQRIMGLTASFETGIGFPECLGVVTGNFDGQGISFGALQWNIGQGTLQELFQAMLLEHPKVAEDIFTKDQLSQFKTMLQGTLTDQLKWAKSIQITERRPNNSLRWVIIPEWKSAFHRLGLTEEMMNIEVNAASVRFEKAKSNCSVYDLHSERGLALMFDINVQNGHVDIKGAGAKIMNDYQGISNLMNDEKEVEKMRIIARRRAEVSNPKWVHDVLSRKMTIAEGEGVVHGKKYLLTKEYSITLNPWNPDKMDNNLPEEAEIPEMS